MSELIRRLFGTTRTDSAPARTRVGADGGAGGNQSAFSNSIQHSQQYADRADRVIHAAEAEIAQLQQQARAYVQAGNRSAAQRCLRLAQQKQAGIAQLQTATRNVGQLTQSAQQTQQSVEAAQLMGELAATQKAYLDEHGGASGVQALMGDVSRTVDEGNLVQEVVADALPEDLFTTADDNTSIDAMLDAMEADAFQQQVPSAIPPTAYDLAPEPVAARAPTGGGGSGASSPDRRGGVAAPVASPSSAPASTSSASSGDLDYYASLLK